MFRTYHISRSMTYPLTEIKKATATSSGENRRPRGIIIVQLTPLLIQEDHCVSAGFLCTPATNLKCQQQHLL